MAKRVHCLTQRFVDNIKGPGMHHDGRGLYLHVGRTGGKSWIFRYQMNSRPRHMGLGAYPDIGLALARQLLAQTRETKALGIDPLATRETRRAEAHAAAARAITFR